MNPIPARLLRPLAEACKSRPPRTDREIRQRAYILDAGQAMFIQHGRADITIAQLALATGITQLAIRRQICDLHHLLGLVLHKHLDAVLDDISHVPRFAPDARAARRAAYFRATRGICNIPTPLHFLLLRERFTLPPDELQSIESQRNILAYMLGGDDGDAVMALLDCPTITLDMVEMMVAPLLARAGARAETLRPDQDQASATAAPPNAPPPRPFADRFHADRSPADRSPADRSPADPAVRERAKFLLEPRHKPLPALFTDAAPSIDPWASLSDDDLRSSTAARSAVPVGPPLPRPAWRPTLVQPTLVQPSFAPPGGTLDDDDDDPCVYAAPQAGDDDDDDQPPPPRKPPH